MMNTSKTVIFFGTEDFSAAALQALITAGYPVVAVITKPDTFRGRSRTQLVEPPVKVIAKRHNIEVWQPNKLADIAHEIESLRPVAGVLSAYGKIIPASILELFEPGIINIHPSLLPKYRGPSPIESAIANGDAVTGVTLMQLAPKMDAGPLYAQQTITLDGTETRPELYDQLGRAGAELLLENLGQILDGLRHPIAQEDEHASYTSLLTKDQALLHPDELTAEEAERLVRAHLGYPKTKVAIGGREIVVLKSHVTDDAATLLDVPFKNGTYLSIDELIAPSGRTVSKQAYLNGYAAGA